MPQQNDEAEERTKMTFATPRDLRRYAAQRLQLEFAGLDAFEEARASLRRQSLERGLDGILRDVQCTLCEDGRTGILQADYGSDLPLIAAFHLPAPAQENEFDSEFYVARCLAGK